ncbi:hypothetical protein ACI3PL_30290, partial [Lacticaseibacillus paracasei]
CLSEASQRVFPKSTTSVLCKPSAVGTTTMISTPMYRETSRLEKFHREDQELPCGSMFQNRV